MDLGEKKMKTEDEELKIVKIEIVQDSMAIRFMFNKAYGCYYYRGRDCSLFIDKEDLIRKFSIEEIGLILKRLDELKPEEDFLYLLLMRQRCKKIVKSIHKEVKDGKKS